MQVIESAKIPCFIALIWISNLCFFYAQVGVARNAMQRSLEEFVKCMAACVVCMCIRNPAYFSKVYFSLKYIYNPPRKKSGAFSTLGRVSDFRVGV